MASRFHVDPSDTIEVYEFDPTEVITDAAPNVIVVKARMDVATAGKVSSELAKLGDDNKIEMHIGNHVLALLLHNVISWRGPDFDGLPCTPANIRALPTGDPFIEKVANEIGERNKPRESPNGRSAPTISTSESAGEAASIASQDGAGLSRRSGNGMSNSPLLNAAIGRQNRSGD